MEEPRTITVFTDTMPSLHDHLALDVVFDVGNKLPAQDRDLTGGTASTVDSEGGLELPIGSNTSYIVLHEMSGFQTRRSDTPSGLE